MLKKLKEVAEQVQEGLTSVHSDLSKTYEAVKQKAEKMSYPNGYYEFEPAGDISTYELALVSKFLLKSHASRTIPDFFPDRFGTTDVEALPDEIKRHFKKIMP